jgi:hypothetical protein
MITIQNTGVNLLSVHNPQAFIINTDTQRLHVNIYDKNDALLDTFACIRYNDNQFVFLCDDILSGYMGDIDDFESGANVIAYVSGMTKIFKLEFFDPENIADKAEVTFDTVQAAQQFGSTPSLDRIFYNDNDTYIAAVGMPMYAYFYNDSEANIITVNTAVLTEEALVDYDDILLLDSDNLYLTTL